MGLSILRSGTRSTARRVLRDQGPLFSTMMSSPPTFRRNDDRDEQWQSRSGQVRSFHASNKNEIILPFLPEIVLFVVVAGGWTIYRTAQGKTIAPDEAIEAQKAYRKHQEKLERTWHRREVKEQRY